MDSEESILLEQLKLSIEDYDNINILLKKSKDGFIEKNNINNDIIQKLKNLKNTEEEFDNVISLADNNQLITNTYKQIDKYVRKKESLDKKLPFEKDSNLLILPL